MPTIFFQTLTTLTKPMSKIFIQSKKIFEDTLMSLFRVLSCKNVRDIVNMSSHIDSNRKNAVTMRIIKHKIGQEWWDETQINDGQLARELVDLWLIAIAVYTGHFRVGDEMPIGDTILHSLLGQLETQVENNQLGEGEYLEVCDIIKKHKEQTDYFKFIESNDLKISIETQFVEKITNGKLEYVLQITCTPYN